MSETPRPQGTAGDARPTLPQLRPSRAFAHDSGAARPGNPHRPDGRPPQTPRGARTSGQRGRLGTTPPVPRRPAFFLHPLLWAGVLCAALFAALTWQVASDGPLRALDERFGRAVVHSPVPTALAEFFADLGNTVVALPVLVLAALYAAWRGRRAAAPRWWLPPLAALVTMAVVPALVVPVKTWLARPGPPEMAGGAHAGFFPSGHGATAAVAYGAVALLLAAPWTARPGRSYGPALTAAVVLLDLAVGVGLVRRAYHWPLDVLASWCLAGVLLAACAAVCGRRADRPHTADDGQPAAPTSSDAM
ncbi:phosphatase PAP2 family protein [Streptomyces chrestomyceticus]|uniref:phosphatase PAP2 family protein n=1 Tax=Streptomyces chrestomyceticus TaxID=68185 RepID=UPI0033FC830F